MTLDIFDEENHELESSILFKVGETVTIRDDIRATMKGVAVDEDMVDYAGMKAKIVEVRADCYHIDLDKGEWVWQDFMFAESYNNPIDEKQVWNML